MLLRYLFWDDHEASSNMFVHSVTKQRQNKYQGLVLTVLLWRYASLVQQVQKLLSRVKSQREPNLCHLSISFSATDKYILIHNKINSISPFCLGLMFLERCPPSAKLYVIAFIRIDYSTYNNNPTDRPTTVMQNTSIFPNAYSNSWEEFFDK